MKPVVSLHEPVCPPNGNGQTAGSDNGYAEPVWAGLRPLPSALPPVQSLDVEWIPESLRPWLFDIAERTQVPLDFVAAPAVVALSGLIGRSVGIYPKRQDDWLVVPNLWGAVIGKPGVLKSPSLNDALKPLRRLAADAQTDHETRILQADAERIILDARLDAAKSDVKGAVKSGDREKLTAAQADIVSINEEIGRSEAHERRYVVNDPTMEKMGEIIKQNPRGVVLIRDELVGFLQGLERQGREQDRAFYLEAWAGAGSFTFDRIGRGTIHIPALTVSIMGGMTPGKLQGYVAGAIGGGAQDDGLLQRFQVAVWPDITPDFINVDRYPDADAKNAAFGVFSSLDRITPADIGADTSGEIPALRFTPEAQELFNEFRNGLEIRLRGGEECAPSFESHIAKYRSLLPSLALIFHLVEVVHGAAQGPVSLAATGRAAAWCDYLETHARRIYAGELNQSLGAARRLAEKIRSGTIHDGMTIRDIYRAGWSGLGDPASVADGIDELEKYGRARIERVDTKGAPSEVIRLNPALISGEAA